MRAQVHSVLVERTGILPKSTDPAFKMSVWSPAHTGAPPERVSVQEQLYETLPRVLWGDYNETPGTPH